jgi:hypothetical protein
VYVVPPIVIVLGTSHVLHVIVVVQVLLAPLPVQVSVEVEPQAVQSVTVVVAGNAQPTRWVSAMWRSSLLAWDRAKRCSAKVALVAFA